MKNSKGAITQLNNLTNCLSLMVETIILGIQNSLPVLKMNRNIDAIKIPFEEWFY